MSLQEQIQKCKSNLTHTGTIIKTVEGKMIREELVNNTFITETLTMTQPGYVVDTKPDLQVAKITRYLFMGSQDVACDENLLCVNNISHVISLGVQPVAKFDGIGYTYVDVLDLPEFDILVVFDEIFGVIDEVVDNNKNVFVHCNAGVSRSATVVIGYLMKRLRLGYESALEMVKSQRCCAKPNSGFERQLKEYEKVINVVNI